MQGDELKAIRKAAGLTQAEMGELLGVSTTIVGQMERDAVDIPKRTELAIDGMARERIDVSYSEAIGKWIVAVTKPAKSPAAREHHLLAAKATQTEAVQRATEEHKRNPFAMFIVRGEPARSQQ